MNLINPNYVTGKKLNDKGELLVKQAQSMIAFFNNVIDGQEGLEISSEEIAKYFTVGKGDFTYLTNDIRPSVKEYLLGSPGVS